ncbi:tat (twin-arginine translocation) pathway signal sequence domain protein [Collimonas arenae]|uniref:Tat (Twin-arginine translocation) pathway signal sequence domain protein n=1 Tax=Collimonas arenae TaxID=279058 RepID=A0A127PK20_9BURK|nr:xanthine dehydrogenase family protein molybdopterin-binding subunit [Collimonas arenae]AMO98065.1 tat (twin-arginine translocation) pathway signal sequence domain protein [Collimonas arenae]AMP07930.1 tat (twin-arginine translocation) pathway signal sequence domain protein [Collimonas arenae]
MTHAIPSKNSRRTFLKASAVSGVGLVLGFYIPSLTGIASAQTATKKSYPPNAFLRVGPDNKVVIQVSKVDIGQGTLTALPMLLAEELDCDWNNVHAELAKGEDVFRDTAFGMQMVGGSTSVAHTYQQYREIGARARSMLVAAAAKQWKVDPAACKTAAGVITGPTGQHTTYGAVANAAMQLPAPETVQLKNPAQFTIIGKATPRLDGAAKSTGQQKFGIDVDLPGMKVALLARAVPWGAKIGKLDDSAAKAIPGVRKIFTIPGIRGGQSVVIVADGYWIAKKARDALKIEWDAKGIERVSSDSLFAAYREAAMKPGTPAAKADVSSLATAPKKIEAVFEFPYLAHTPMEPLNMTLHFTGDACTVWTGSQFQSMDRQAIAKVLGIAITKVDFNTMMAGGAFGRRALPESENAVEAAYIAKVMRGTPVKVMYSREDDLHGGYYRPMHVHRVRIGYDASGKIAAWDHVIAGQSILTGSPFESFLVKDGVDGTMTEGVLESHYAIPNLALSVHNMQANVPVLWHRSVGHSHNGYVMETLIDEIARSVGRDPVEYRKALFAQPGGRSSQALDLAVTRSGYGKRKLEAGHAWGVAVHHAFDTSVAYVAEVSLKDGRPQVHRVTAGVHCNMAINPRTIEAQIQGGLVFGLSSIQPGYEITLKDGVVQQSNFPDYMPVLMGQCPTVEVYLVPSADTPTGVGEPPVPPIAPAIANAVAALTGKRLRKLPFETIAT